MLNVIMLSVMVPPKVSRTNKIKIMFDDQRLVILALIMLAVVMLTVVMLSVVMLAVIMLAVVMVSIVVPFQHSISSMSTIEAFVIVEPYGKFKKYIFNEQIQ